MNCFKSLLVTAVSLAIGNAFGAPVQNSQMYVIDYHSFGASNVLQWEEVARPVPGKNEVLIKVKAAGVNPVDAFIRGGGLFDKSVLPTIPGHDIAGEVVSVGSGVDKKYVGENVMAMLPLTQAGGGYAQYVAVASDLIAPQPKNIDAIHAAAVPLAALTAYQALFDHGHLHAGQTVLIQGASGGVGHFAVQLAKQAGARVIGTASKNNIDFTRGLGADVVIDYQAQRFEDVAKNVDLVIDTVGGDTLKRSYAVIRQGGTIVTLRQPPDPQSMAAAHIKGERMAVHTDGRELTLISNLIASNAVKPQVSATYPIQDAAKAQDELKNPGGRGKIVLLVGSTGDGK